MQLVFIFSFDCNTNFDFWEVPKALFVVFRWFYFAIHSIKIVAELPLFLICFFTSFFKLVLGPVLPPFYFAFFSVFS